MRRHDYFVASTDAQRETAKSRATEPLQTATPNWRPTFAANPSSKRPTKGPSEEIHPDRIHSTRYASRSRLTAVR